MDKREALTFVRPLIDYDLEYFKEEDMEYAEAEAAKHHQSLPQDFREYSTASLLEMWQRWKNKEELAETEAGSKIDAMWGLLKAYRLKPVSWGWDADGDRISEAQGEADLERAKKLLTPFGFNPQELEAYWTKGWEEQLEEAANMLKEGLPSSEVARKTGLALEVIEKLK